jgi:hypothetical protein
MLRSVLDRALERRSTVYGACAVSFAIGLFFVFVWAPHPWGHEGFDHYYQFALTVVAGRPFPTLDYPWGYAYYLAAFYRLFGDHPWIPLTAQVLLNASVPWLVFELAYGWFDRRTATVAAILTSIFSFNTVYASTQSSDAMCTVIFLASVLALIRGIRGRDWRWIVLAGALAGIAPQFRPNLILIPVLFAGWVLWTSGRAERAGYAAILLLSPAILLAPWVIRNYRLTRTLLPTSVHSGVQLWYGTLQMGPYLTSRAYNPRTIFETPTFEYTSLDWLPLLVSARTDGCTAEPPLAASLVYWSDRDLTHTEVAGHIDGRDVTFEVPSPPAPAVVYYYLTAWRAGLRGTREYVTPPAGTAAPLVYFVSNDHLGDRDLHGDLLDSFDVIRMMRRRAWDEPLPFADKLTAAGIDGDDLNHPLQVLKRALGDESTDGQPIVADFTSDDREARLTLSDGSTITVPRVWQGRITDLIVRGRLAGALLSSTIRLSALQERRRTGGAGGSACTEFAEIAVNKAFYRSELHVMRRHFALAFDNIRRAPLAFGLATIYRAGRLFVVMGTDDPSTSQQFEQGGRVYAVATAASAAYLLLFACGVALAWQDELNIALPMLLILYVPATIAPMLTNMRYTVTVQPLMFMFAALAVTAALRRLKWIA